MQNFKNWLISALLRKDGLVAVPQAWQKEYVQLAGDKLKNHSTIAALVTAYNELLLDFFNKCSIKDLQSELADVKGVKTNMSKKELVDLAYEEFKMKVEKN